MKAAPVYTNASTRAHTAKETAHAASSRTHFCSVTTQTVVAASFVEPIFQRCTLLPQSRAHWHHGRGLKLTWELRRNVIRTLADHGSSATEVSGANRNTVVFRPRRLFASSLQRRFRNCGATKNKSTSGIRFHDYCVRCYNARQESLSSVCFHFCRFVVSVRIEDLCSV